MSRRFIPAKGLPPGALWLSFANGFKEFLDRRAAAASPLRHPHDANSSAGTSLGNGRFPWLHFAERFHGPATCKVRLSALRDAMTVVETKNGRLIRGSPFGSQHGQPTRDQPPHRMGRPCLKLGERHNAFLESWTREKWSASPTRRARSAAGEGVVFGRVRVRLGATTENAVYHAGDQIPTWFEFTSRRSLGSRKRSARWWAVWRPSHRSAWRNFLDRGVSGAGALEGAISMTRALITGITAQERLVPGS